MRNEQLNNTCILFDPLDEAQQKAIIKFYCENGYPTNLIRKQDKENCIGVRSGELDYWYKTDLLKVIELPSDYYPKIVPLTEDYLKNFNVKIEDNNGWISVEDRLPEIGIVILITDGKEVYAGKRTKDVELPFNFIENDFDRYIQYPDDESSYNSFFASIVTHWQPLPKSPTRK